jgi:hypothetical protein
MQQNQLMIAKSPERLWKYRVWGDHAHRMVVSGELYFSTIQQLNDPFEFRWRERIPSTPDEIDVYCRELCAYAFPKDSMSQRKARFVNLKRELTGAASISKGRPMPTVARFEHGVCCLSDVCDDILMWSHYAAQHTGVCVGIRPERVTGKLFRPVEYSEDVPLLDAWEYIRGGKDTFVRLGLTKASHWSYEKEWRTVDLAGPKQFPGCVDRIIIGARVTDETGESILTAVKAAAEAGNKIEVLFARQSPVHYELKLRTPIEMLTSDEEKWTAMLFRNEQLYQAQRPKTARPVKSANERKL